MDADDWKPRAMNAMSAYSLQMGKPLGIALSDAKAGEVVEMDGCSESIPVRDMDRYGNYKPSNNNKMETKSRYEVISDLEMKKRELIRERDGLKDALRAKEINLKEAERKKVDTIVFLDRQISDIKEEVAVFASSMTERKETIVELIKGIDKSLDRFAALSKKK